MPIKVTCACGQSFAAKDELAGRTVKCPKCSRPLAIPAAGAAGTAPSAPAAAAPQQPAAPTAGAAPTFQSGGLFDEVGLPSAPTGTIPCPGCRAPMPMGAIICVQCGYNMKLGRRMETMRIGADGSTDSGTVTDMFLTRAARALEEDKEEERKKTREGLPWWAYLVMLLGLIGFMAMMMMIPQRSAIAVAGSVLIVVGWLLCLYSGICILIVAFKENPLQGLLCLFVVPGCPIYTLIFIITRWDQCAGFFFMNLGGTAVICAGIGVVIVGNMIMGQPEQVFLPMMRDGIMLAQAWQPGLHLGWEMFGQFSGPR
jgi:hypothetical protein